MDSFCAIYIDTGTTNTRVWLARGPEIIARASAMVGVRDTARDGSSERLRNALRDLIAEVSSQGQDALFVAAAGMITSSLGLAEVPHVIAPAGIDLLVANTQSFDFPEIAQLPFLLVPGVRTGNLEEAETADLMRGEETMCAGLLELGIAQPPCTVINLGSHWKVIQIDGEGRIAASVTSLTGELIHATQTQTILASAVPQGKPETLDPDWIEAGMREQRRSGLARTLFCVRLLEQGKRTTAEERMAYLIGAFIAADLDPLIRRGVIGDRAIITGGGAIAEAWREALRTCKGSSIETRIVSSVEIEKALIAGLGKITTAARIGTVRRI